VTPEDKAKWKKALKYDVGRQIQCSNPKLKIKRNLRECIINCGHSNYTFNWGLTPQGQNFWHEYYNSKNEIEGKAILKEVMTEFCEEMKLEDYI
jgi:hypothetical protein